MIILKVSNILFNIGFVRLLSVPYLQFIHLTKNSNSNSYFWHSFHVSVMQLIQHITLNKLPKPPIHSQGRLGNSFDFSARLVAYFLIQSKNDL